MAPPKDTTSLIGQRFTKLTVLQRGPAHPKHQLWECHCDCGAMRVVKSSSLRSGETKSCGCWTKERLTKHGQRSAGKLTPEYVCWKNMRTRCNNPNQRWKQKWYADVTVDPRWDDFATFLQDVGPRPSPRHTLDRFPNPAGPYAPGNVRWATWSEQRRNQRTRLTSPPPLPPG